MAIEAELRSPSTSVFCVPFSPSKTTCPTTFVMQTTSDESGVLREAQLSGFDQSPPLEGPPQKIVHADASGCARALAPATWVMKGKLRERSPTANVTDRRAVTHAPSELFGKCMTMRTTFNHRTPSRRSRVCNWGGGRNERRLSSHNVHGLVTSRPCSESSQFEDDVSPATDSCRHGKGLGDRGTLVRRRSVFFRGSRLDPQRHCAMRRPTDRTVTIRWL